MLSNGSRLREIQEATGIRPSAVSTAAREYGVVRGVFSEVRDAVALVLAGGLSVAQASEKTGVARHRINYALRAQLCVNRKLQFPESVDVERWDAIAAMKESGATFAKVAERYGITRQRVHQIIKKRASYAAWREQQGE